MCSCNSWFVGSDFLWFSWVTIWVVNLPERAEKNLITGLDNTVRVGQSCNSLLVLRISFQKKWAVWKLENTHTLTHARSHAQKKEIISLYLSCLDRMGFDQSARNVKADLSLYYSNMRSDTISTAGPQC